MPVPHFVIIWSSNKLPKFLITSKWKQKVYFCYRNFHSRKWNKGFLILGISINQVRYLKISLDFWRFLGISQYAPGITYCADITNFGSTHTVCKRRSQSSHWFRPLIDTNDSYQAHSLEMATSYITSDPSSHRLLIFISNFELGILWAQLEREKNIVSIVFVTAPGILSWVLALSDYQKY